METRKNSYAGGLILILIGGFLLARQLFPAMRAILDWPWIIMGVGLVFLLVALFTRTGALAIPGMIVGGVGAILWYQNLTGQWETWAFAWTLMPGFVGAGLALAALISPQEHRDAWTPSLFLIAISAIMFVIFGGSRFFGLNLDFLWPVIIIVFGLFLLLRGMLRKA